MTEVMTISNISILTGAGFSKNFGGFLATEMWSLVLNNPQIQKQPKIREVLLKDMNFENVYSQVVESSTFLEEEKKVFMSVIYETYKKLDESISRFMPQRDDYFELDQMGKLIFLPSPYSGKERALWFTLNQDLFFERHRNWRAAGAPLFNNEFYRLPSQVTPKSIRLPSPEEISRSKLQEALLKALEGHVGMSYIKLHGSYCWESFDGKPGMILGVNKAALIEREPLLKCYFDLFRETLFREGQKLLVIGYGFRDLHVNNILIEAIQKYGLKIFVINPSDPGKFKDSLQSALDAQASGNFQIMWGALHGYFPYRLKEIFYEEAETVPWREIREAIQ